MNESLLVRRGQQKLAGVDWERSHPGVVRVMLGGGLLRAGQGGAPGPQELKSWCSIFQDIDLIDILWRQDIDPGLGERF